MLINIPAHLEKLEIISQLSKMIKGYSEYYKETSNSFDYYYYYYSSDKVKNFIEFCISQSSISSENEYSGVVDYLTKLFYSVKGTLKVFDYMKKYLQITFKGDIIYTINEIIIDVDEITTIDMSLFIKSMKEFIGVLLYYGELKSSIDTIILLIQGKISSTTATEIIKYKEYIAEEIL